MADERGYVLRLAVEADAKELAQVHIRSWREIYKNIFPYEVLKRLDAAKHATYWRSAITQAPADTVVCEMGLAIIGFLSLGAAVDGDYSDSMGEITSIYLDPKYWSSGYGTALMDWALSQAKCRGWRRIILWSLQENLRARLFYESMGYYADGGTKRGCLGERFSDAEELYVTLTKFSKSLKE